MQNLLNIFGIFNNSFNFFNIDFLTLINICFSLFFCFLTIKVIINNIKMYLRNSLDNQPLFTSTISVIYIINLGISLYSFITGTISSFLSYSYNLSICLFFFFYVYSVTNIPSIYTSRKQRQLIGIITYIFAIITISIFIMNFPLIDTVKTIIYRNEKVLIPSNIKLSCLLFYPGFSDLPSLLIEILFFLLCEYLCIKYNTITHLKIEKIIIILSTLTIFLSIYNIINSFVFYNFNNIGFNVISYILFILIKTSMFCLIYISNKDNTFKQNTKLQLKYFITKGLEKLDIIKDDDNGNFIIGDYVKKTVPILVNNDITFSEIKEILNFRKIKNKKLLLKYFNIYYNEEMING